LSNSFDARGTIQNILVLRDENTVVVSTGSGEFPFEYLVEQYILPAIEVSSSSWVPWVIGGSGALILAASEFMSYGIRKRKNKK